MDTPVKTAGSVGIPFYSIYWLAKEYQEHRIIQKIPKHRPVTYLKALVPIQLAWRLTSTHASPPQTRKCQYHSKLSWILPDPYQMALLPMEPLPSNAYLTASYVPVKTKCLILKYRIGTLYNQKHAVLIVQTLNKSNLPPLPSARQCPAYPFWMPTHTNKKYDHWERQLSSMIFKAISKTGSPGSCFVCMDVGSSERLAMQNLQNPDTAGTRIISKWCFPPRFLDKNRFAYSRPDAVMVAPISAKTKKQQTASNGWDWILRSGRRQMGRQTGAPLQHR